MPNKKEIGNKAEKLALQKLSEKGWWCHLFAYNANGQPCDIVALKRNQSMLLDVKHCEKDYFEVRRIEPNQRTCFAYASSLGIICGFMLYSESKKDFYYLPFDIVNDLPNVKKFYIDELHKMGEII